MSAAIAHDIQNGVSLHAFVKPEGERLHLLIRIPLALLGTLDLPKRGPGYLDLARIGDQLVLAAAVTANEFELREDGEALFAARSVQRITLSSDDAFRTYSRALERIHGPQLPVETDVFWKDGYFDVHLEYPIRSERGDFTLDVQTARNDGVTVDVRFLPPGGSERIYVLSRPVTSVALDASWQRAFWVFVKSGVVHILGGYDHLLFLLCVVLPFRRLSWRLLGIVTSFTVAHTITLFAAAFDLVPAGSWFPPLVEALIAMSIICMAIENLLAPNLDRRWLITGIFGLVHGLGFSFALRDELKFAGDHLVLSLVSFNAGIEIGQFIVLALLLPTLASITRWRLSERYVPIGIAIGVVITASFWLFERATVLVDVASSLRLADQRDNALRVLGFLLIAAGVGYWLIGRALRRRRSVPEPLGAAQR